MEKATVALPRGNPQSRNHWQSGENGTVNKPVKHGRTFREMVPFFAAPKPAHSQNGEV